MVQNPYLYRMNSELRVNVPELPTFQLSASSAKNKTGNPGGNQCIKFTDDDKIVRANPPEMFALIMKDENRSLTYLQVGK